jgi:hypothetical protein
MKKSALALALAVLCVLSMGADNNCGFGGPVKPTTPATTMPTQGCADLTRIVDSQCPDMYNDTCIVDILERWARFEAGGVAKRGGVDSYFGIMACLVDQAGCIPIWGVNANGYHILVNANCNNIVGNVTGALMGVCQSAVTVCALH